MFKIASLVAAILMTAASLRTPPPQPPVDFTYAHAVDEIQRFRRAAFGDTMPLDVCKLTQLYGSDGRVTLYPGSMPVRRSTRAECDRPPARAPWLGVGLQSIRRNGDTILVHAIWQRAASTTIREEYRLLPGGRRAAVRYCILVVQQD